ncbi:hypothetical protein BBR47_35710 [Brevibacillus brevis NBRC 100599]|uniref:Uncharacterized protein n=1 Tax=Brevibacillus brevis (strain 47 / JCM 6285 / NBRC 100599) TaxID=358681 RepID=C0ZFI9_BREBN|nr:hypothetical protein [Brevibacillus brevis]BAH44548.1 hypothetical protein BBR47_35710 [Brevibacillus brevis NBRC 100599]
MSAPVLDFQEYVEKTEPSRQRSIETLAFDIDNSGIEWTVRDVIEELELLVDGKATMDFEDFVDGIREQARRLLK